MQPIATDGVAWSVGLSVGRSVGLCLFITTMSSKNGWTNQGGIWDVEWGVPEELRII